MSSMPRSAPTASPSRRPRRLARLALVPVAVAAPLLATLIAAPAHAASDDPCPTSVNGSGSGQMVPATVSVLAGGYVENIDVAGNDGISLVCAAGTGYGYAFVYDGFAGYSPAPGPDSVQTFTVGGTDGDRYYSTEVTVNVDGFADPTLKRALEKKGGKVTQKAKVAFHNTTDYPVKVLAGSFNNDEPDLRVKIPAGESSVVTTKRAHLDFIGLVSTRKVYATVRIAGINTQSGTVRDASSFRSGAARRLPLRVPLTAARRRPGPRPAAEPDPERDPLTGPGTKRSPAPSLSGRALRQPRRGRPRDLLSLVRGDDGQSPVGPR